jgi:hypothetical protein
VIRSWDVNEVALDGLRRVAMTVHGGLQWLARARARAEP